MDIEKLPVSHVVRYCLTGLIAILVFIAPPLAIFTPSILKEMSLLASIAGFITLAFLMGFVLDALKVYQLHHGYRRERKEFYNRISNELSVSQEDAPLYFIKALIMEKDKFGGALFMKHSRWVLMTVSSTLLLSSSCLWFVLSLVLAINGDRENALAFAIVVIIVTRTTPYKEGCRK